jgi:hypothetical protein
MTPPTNIKGSRRSRSSKTGIANLEGYGVVHLLRPPSAENEDERDDDLRTLLGELHNATVQHARFRGVGAWEGWVLLFWGIEVDKAERERFEPEGARYWESTLLSPPPPTTATYRAIRVEVRQERGRFMMRTPRPDEDLLDVSGPHYVESPVWARIEWPNGGRRQGHWMLSGIPFTGRRPTLKAMTKLGRDLSVAFDILAAWSLGQGRRAGDGVRWSSNAEALREIDEQIRKGRHGATAVAVAIGVDRSTVYRRVLNATGLRWPDYVASVISRDFAQH